MAELEKTIKDKIADMYQQAMQVFSLENPDPALNILSDAWNILPVEKHDYDEGYMLSKAFTFVYYRRKDYSNALKWCDTFIKCDKAQRNYGESEFLAGKIAFELGNMDEAKTYIEIANQKSEGRCFSGEDKKYKKLLDKKNIRPKGLKALLDLSSKEFKNNNFSYALSLLYDCLNIQQMNPLVHLQKGKCHFELGELDHAADSFTRAYMLEGIDIFKGEDQKYLEFLKTKIEIK